MSEIRQEIIDFICKADWEGGYDYMIDQRMDMVPQDTILKNHAEDWNLARQRFEERLRELAEEHDVDINNPYLYEDDDY